MNTHSHRAGLLHHVSVLPLRCSSFLVWDAGVNSPSSYFGKSRVHRLRSWTYSPEFQVGRCFPPAHVGVAPEVSVLHGCRGSAVVLRLIPPPLSGFHSYLVSAVSLGSVQVWTLYLSCLEFALILEYALCVFFCVCVFFNQFWKILSSLHGLHLVALIKCMLNCLTSLFIALTLFLYILSVFVSGSFILTYFPVPKLCQTCS